MLNTLYLLLFSFIIFGDNIQSSSTEDVLGKVIFVVSNADFYGQTDIPCSNHFAELVYPYDELTNAGYQVDFVSPEGGAVPLGYFNTSEPIIKEYLFDCTFMDKLKHTMSPDEVNKDEYRAIYYGGGGAAMFGVADNIEIQKIAVHIYENNHGVVSSVCHGSYGIANIKNSKGGYLVEGKKVNGFPDIFERKDAEYFQAFEHSVEGLLRKRGATFVNSEEGWDGYFAVDGRLITGQDPSSARKVAELIIETLTKNN